MSILLDDQKRQLPGLVLEHSDELLTIVNYFARIKVPNKDPVLTGPREAVATRVNKRLGRAEAGLLGGCGRDTRTTRRAIMKCYHPSPPPPCWLRETLS